jgi:NAD(P)-dependent dehydrogenase (short-subunit alcohol dehydrogenase family)
VAQAGRRFLRLAGDVGDEQFCRRAVRQTLRQLGRLDILVNNAAVQFPQDSLEKISARQLERTFRTNIFSYFFMARAALPRLSEGSVIINTTSVTAYRGSPNLIDYAATKGAIVAFTRSLAHSLVEKGIRVNGVAPGPIWTPLIPASFPARRVTRFGSDVPMGRAGEPEEVAPASSSWPRTTRLTSPARCSTPTGVRLSMARACWRGSVRAGVRNEDVHYEI